MHQPFDVNFIYGAIGGRDRFQKLLAFAEENCTDELLDEYNAAVEAEDTARILKFLTFLSLKYIEIHKEIA